MFSHSFIINSFTKIVFFQSAIYRHNYALLSLCSFIWFKRRMSKNNTRWYYNVKIGIFVTRINAFLLKKTTINFCLCIFALNKEELFKVGVPFQSSSSIRKWHVLFETFFVLACNTFLWFVWLNKIIQI